MTDELLYLTMDEVLRIHERVLITGGESGVLYLGNLDFTLTLTRDSKDDIFTKSAVILHGIVVGTLLSMGINAQHIQQQRCFF